MNPRVIGAVLMLTPLTGFASGCSQPPAQAASEAPAEAATTPPRAPAAPEATTVRAAASSASLAGEYEGDFDGASAAVTISGSAPRYNVHIIIGADGCAGGALGPAQVDGAGVLTVRPTDDASCSITMTPTASGFSVEEHQCSNLHGDACAFSGELHRAH